MKNVYRDVFRLPGFWVALLCTVLLALPVGLHAQTTGESRRTRY